MTASEGAVVSTLKKWIHGAAFRRLIEFGSAAVTSYFASKTLARLSGTALWVPAEWRDSVDVLISAFGATVFVATRILVEIIQSSAPKLNAKEKEHEKLVLFKVLAVSAASILAAIFFWPALCGLGQNA